MANIYPNDPAQDAFAVTPSDTGGISARALYIGVSGDVKIDTAAGSAITFSNAVGGTILPIRATRVYSTGTTATGIVGLA